MKPTQIIELCQAVDNLMCCVFSPTGDDSYKEFDKFAYLACGAKPYISQRTIKFTNNSQIRFITIRGSEDERRNIMGLEIGLAVMNSTYPSDNLKLRMRFGSCTAPVSFGLPRIVELED